MLGFRFEMLYNNFMSQNKPSKLKTENLKTETSFKGKMMEMEFGKPVKLPYIRKSNHNQQNVNISRNSLEGKDVKGVRNSNKELMLDQTHLHMLTLQEIQLCNEKITNECFPRIYQHNPIVHREHSIESLKQIARIKSEKSIMQIDAWEYLKDYKIGSIIGRGSYAIVRICKNKEGKKFAIKTYCKMNLLNEDKKKNLDREIQILSKIQHPNILKYVETIHSDDAVHIVTELLQNISLVDYLKNQSVKKIVEANAALIMQQICKAMGYLHAKDIVHRDIKLENILISKDLSIKLIDFGFSLQLQKQNYSLYDFCGTPHYIAPEVVMKEGYMGKSADIWSLGILLYRLVVGSFPFKGMNDKALFNKVIKGQYKMPPDLSAPLQSILHRMLSPDFRHRPTIEELANSEWLKS